MMEQPTIAFLSLLLAGLAFGVSIATLWLTQLRKGTVKMTRPSQIYLGPDGGAARSSKVFMHTLLYSTSNLGRHVEDIYVELVHSQSSRIFPIWVHGDNANMKRGSGLFVNRSGVSVPHHFLSSEEDQNFTVNAGIYRVNVYAKLAGEQSTWLLHTTVLNVSVDEAVRLNKENVGIYFDWGPRSNSYISHIDKRPNKNAIEDVFSKLLESQMGKPTARKTK